MSFREQEGGDLTVIVILIAHSSKIFETDDDLAIDGDNGRVSETIQVYQVGAVNGPPDGVVQTVGGGVLITILTHEKADTSVRREGANSSGQTSSHTTPRSNVDSASSYIRPD